MGTCVSESSPVKVFRDSTSFHFIFFKEQGGGVTESQFLKTEDNIKHKEWKYFLRGRENIFEERGSAVLTQCVPGDIFSYPTCHKILLIT